MLHAECDFVEYEIEITGIAYTKFGLGRRDHGV